MEILVFGAGPIGLLFVVALAMDGHRVILADPNRGRLKIGKKLGAAETIEIARGGGQADMARAKTQDGRGAWFAIDAAGVPEACSDVIDSVRPGGLVNLYGGCAPGTSTSIDTHSVHYSELTIKGTYYYRPETIQKALKLLANLRFKVDLLLSAERTIEDVEDALRSMMRKESLKVVIKKQLWPDAIAAIN